jgi:branched-subunit amino acid ABC-type transport system permease component
MPPSASRLPSPIKVLLQIFLGAAGPAMLSLPLAIWIWVINCRPLTVSPLVILFLNLLLLFTAIRWLRGRMAAVFVVTAIILTVLLQQVARAQTPGRSRNDEVSSVTARLSRSMARIVQAREGPIPLVHIAPTILALAGVPPAVGMSASIPEVSDSSLAPVDYSKLHRKFLVEQNGNEERLKYLRSLGYIGN